MAFDFDIEYIKGNMIPHMDALSRLQFHKASKDNAEEIFEDMFLHWVEIDILSVDRMAAEITQQSKIFRSLT